MHVSINAYQDASLLTTCLKTIRQQLPDASIQVVDGRYETWPASNDNSTDDTAFVADTYGADYIPGGPYESEAAKHEARVQHAPEGDRLLFMDADERLLKAAPGRLDDKTAYKVRIHNALMYNTGITYYPRLFYPRQWDEAIRVDRFSFDAAVERTDDVTIVHRADLRNRDYRRDKLERFGAEDRDPWYRDYLETVEEQGFDATFYECPECGEMSVTESRVCGYGDEYTRVRTCTASDECYSAIEPVRVGHYRYLPDHLDRGFREDPERVRLELMDAGNDLARVLGPRKFKRYQPNARIWVDEEFQDAGHPTNG